MTTPPKDAPTAADIEAIDLLLQASEHPSLAMSKGAHRMLDLAIGHVGGRLGVTGQHLAERRGQTTPAETGGEEAEKGEAVPNRATRRKKPARATKAATARKRAA